MSLRVWYVAGVLHDLLKRNNGSQTETDVRHGSEPRRVLQPQRSFELRKRSSEAGRGSTSRRSAETRRSFDVRRNKDVRRSLETGRTHVRRSLETGRTHATHSGVHSEARNSDQNTCLLGLAYGLSPLYRPDIPGTFLSDQRLSFAAFDATSTQCPHVDLGIHMARDGLELTCYTNIVQLSL
jgi:hypothetical protein